MTPHGITASPTAPAALDFAGNRDDGADMPDGAAHSPDDISLRARVTTLWRRLAHNPSAMIVANSGVQSVLRMGSNVVLARLLAPSAFALVAITSLILTGMAMVSDVGIAVTALREGEMSREDEYRLWTMQLLRGLAVGALMLAAAAPVGWLYHDAQLGRVLAALALMPVLQGAQSLYPILAMGRRQLLPSTLLEVGSKVAGMIASILIALVSPTVWALVVGTLAGTFFATVGGHAMGGYRPRFVVDRAYIANQWGFSRWIQVASTVYFLGGQVDKPLFPFLYGMTTLGVYGIGGAFATMPAQVTQRWSANVFYPLTTQLLRGGAAARAQLLRVRTTMLFYTAVMTLAVAAAAPPFFMLFYKPQYYGAARFAQILTIGIFFDTAESSLRHMPLVEGNPRYELWAVVVKLIGFVAAAAVVVALRGDAYAYAYAVSAGAVVGHLYMTAVCVRRGYLRAGPDLAFSGGLIVAIIALNLMPAPPATPWLLVAEGAGIALAAAAVSFVLHRRRGLPSLPAEPAPQILREAAVEEELGLLPGAV